MKTVLVPGAPWPSPKAKVSAVPKPKTTSKIAHTNKKFDEWAAKQPVDFKKILGDLQNARVQSSLGRKQRQQGVQDR